MTDTLRALVKRLLAAADELLKDVTSFDPALGDRKLAALLREAAEALSARGDQAPAAPQGETWQPIETAPKDGTRVEFCNTENGLTDKGYWESWVGKPDWHRDLLPDFAKDWDGEWCTDDGNGDMTHWRPSNKAPTPPAAYGQEESQ